MMMAIMMRMNDSIVVVVVVVVVAISELLPCLLLRLVDKCRNVIFVFFIREWEIFRGGERV